MRNPFRIRTSQKTVNDEQFVRLFGAGALDMIDEIADPFGGLVILRSAPGGGKTSFLRLLTPNPLRLAIKFNKDPYVKQTYDSLRNRGAIGDEGPTLLGVMATITSEYRDLDDFDCGLGMFRALLNARIVTATVRTILERSNRSYPDDLDTVHVQWKPDIESTIPAKATGKELYDWATKIERTFYDRLDDLGEGTGFEGHTRLDALTWFSTSSFHDVNGEVSVRRLLMFDESQFLSKRQHKSLMTLLTNARANCGIWVAERLEALNYQEILSKGVLRRRDYEGIVQPENLWASRQKTYVKFVSQIAELRSRHADGFEDRDFFGLLSENDERAVWSSVYERACDSIRKRIETRTDNNPRYKGWISEDKLDKASPYDQALYLRKTEILIERDLAKRQGAFDLTVLSDDDYSSKDSSSLSNATRHILRKEVDAPIYFGKDSLSAISSWNVDQYVDVAGDIFEEISAKITGVRATPAALTTERQHKIIKNAAQKRWNAIPQRILYGYDARRLLEAAGKFCYQQTFRPTAPYAPGVTGFAITMEDRTKLMESTKNGNGYFHKLRDILESLIANNEIVTRLEHQNKGKEYMVFYLNRLLCVHFDLPLGYGGWREKSLQQMQLWLEQGMNAVVEDTLVD